MVRLVNDAGGLQVLQLDVLDGETRSAAERLQEFGFSSRPPAGAEAVVLFPGGRRDHALVVAVDDRRHRPRDLEEGESILYSSLGDYVRIRQGHIVEIVAATKVRVQAPLAEVVGNMTISGTLAVTGAVTAASVAAATTVSDAGGTMASMRSTYNAHTHGENGDGGGVTDPPNQGM